GGENENLLADLAHAELDVAGARQPDWQPGVSRHQSRLERALFSQLLQKWSHHLLQMRPVPAQLQIPFAEGSDSLPALEVNPASAINDRRVGHVAFLWKSG